MARRFTRLELEAIIDMASIAGAGLEGEGDYQTWERRNYRAASTAAQKAHALIHRLDERREARRRKAAAAATPATPAPASTPNRHALGPRFKTAREHAERDRAAGWDWQDPDHGCSCEACNHYRNLGTPAAPTVGPGEVPLSCGHPMIDANAGACGVRGCVNEHQAE